MTLSEVSLRRLPGAFERGLKGLFHRPNPAYLWLRVSVCFLAILLHGAISPAPVQAVSPQEYQIKAVFLYNFALFVEWPASSFPDSRAPIVIGILGRDPFDTYLQEAISGEKVNNRLIIIAHYNSVEEIKQCHILFISSSESGRLETHLQALVGRPILTVADFEGFAQRGGMIRFKNENNKVRFRINVEATTSANLTVSSKLLRHADIISPGKD
jgi:hypothetical protein